MKFKAKLIDSFSNLVLGRTKREFNEGEIYDVVDVKFDIEYSSSIAVQIEFKDVSHEDDQIIETNVTEWINLNYVYPNFSITDEKELDKEDLLKKIKYLNMQESYGI